MHLVVADSYDVLRAVRMLVAMLGLLAMSQAELRICMAHLLHVRIDPVSGWLVPQCGSAYAEGGPGGWNPDGQWPVSMRKMG